MPEFLPIVRRWFAETFSEATRPQREGWEAIASQRDTLIVDCVVRLQARAGMAFEASFVQVVTIRNGLIVRSDDYLNRAAGLKAAGLEE